MDYTEPIFKDNRKVIPNLWYRYLTMMQEQECRIYQDYSAMDPQKRLKVQPFAEARTTFVPKEPDEEREKQINVYRKLFGVSKTNRGTIEERMMENRR
ncbi:hypothetical protein Tco_0947369 [Tanacetum coccineum]